MPTKLARLEEIHADVFLWRATPRAIGPREWARWKVIYRRAHGDYYCLAPSDPEEAYADNVNPLEQEIPERDWARVFPSSLQDEASDEDETLGEAFGAAMRAALLEWGKRGVRVCGRYADFRKLFDGPRKFSLSSLTQRRAEIAFLEWSIGDDYATPPPSLAALLAAIDSEVPLRRSDLTSRRAKRKECLIFGEFEWAISNQENLLSDRELRLLLLEELDRDRRRFERLGQIHEQGKRAALVKRTEIPEEVRRIVWVRDGGRCVACGSEVQLEYDHLIPAAKGGGSQEGNVRLLCLSCNRRKGDRI